MMKEFHPLRCETCDHYHDDTNEHYGMCYAEPAHREQMYNDTYDHVKRYGCASHSSAASGREQVLDELERRIGKHIIPVGFGGKKLLTDLQDQINQMRKGYRSKQGEQI